MALVSPGVEVTIVDESQYLPAAPASVPMIVLATAQNKTNASGTGIAAGTTAANANKLYAITSQRDLVTIFGNPFFYKTTNGTPLQGYELNEYGLLAAYSVLGTTNLIYAIRADIDLASLIGRTGRPAGAPDDGTHWLDTTLTTWGIFEFNASTGQFTRQTPLVVNDPADIADSFGRPQQYVGNIGDYAITFICDSNGYTVAGEPSDYSTYWYKTSVNEWQEVGSIAWRSSMPTIQGSNAPTNVSAGSIVINGTSVAVPVSPSNTVTGLASAINSANIPWVTAAANANGRLEIYCELQTQTVIIGGGSTAAVLNDLGIVAGTYYAPAISYGTNAQQPLWRSTDSQPRPTGSVWVKTNAANGGTSLVMGRYSSAAALFTNVQCPLSTSDAAINATLDSTGGGAIPVGSLYAQYGFDSTFSAPLMVFRRASSGPSSFVGSATSPAFNNSASFDVYVSQANSSSLSGPYTVTMPGSGSLDASSFVTAWTAAAIPDTTAEVSSTGAIVLTHTLGGVIVLDDGGQSASTSPVVDAGFVVGTTTGAKFGPYKTMTYTGVSSSSTGGSGATFNISTIGYTAAFTINAPGSGYSVNDMITVTGGNPYTAFTANYQLKVTSVSAGAITGVVLVSGLATPAFSVQLSAWQPLSYVPNPIAPTLYPANNTNWFFSVVNQVDIMTNAGGSWQGYRNVCYASNGLPQATGTPATDPNGPITSASAPTTQSDGTALVYGDLWIDTNDLENYPVISRWESVDGVDQWVAIDNTDQLTENGIVFADARWGSNGTIDPVFDPVPTIQSLLTSNYVDLDCPDPDLYPQGTLLFNTRRSGYNVKQFRLNYFNNTSFPGASLPQETSTWVTVSGNMSNGAPYMGRQAQRNMVVQAMRATVATSSQLREEETFFNLMATPNYPELQPSMITLNNDRNQTAYIVGDTPMRLVDDANSIIDWATNTAGATSTGEQGLVTRDTYMGLYYPSGLTTDLTGSEVAVPPSHMILRTMIYNDTVAYPWFAPAGQRRGVIDNATNIGYINPESGEFVVTKNRVQLRDVQYTNFINPIAFFQNLGLLNYGNKNSFDSQSALDRTNVARLICYLRWQLQRALRPFIFEPNDNITRSQARAVVATLLADVQAKRGIYDYIVVCDESNNTPARIDRNELWVDVAIEPVKAAEFIYVPVRILNTGEIAGLGQNG